MKFTAHYYAAIHKGAIRRTLIIGTNGDISGDRLIDEIIVSGQREARKIAAERGAVPHNF